MILNKKANCIQLYAICFFVKIAKKIRISIAFFDKMLYNYYKYNFKNVYIYINVNIFIKRMVKI